MLEIERRFYSFKRKDIWFSERPYDVDGYQGVVFYSCRDQVDVPGFTRRDFITPVIDLTPGLEKVWKNIDRWSCRKKINKAYNYGIEVKFNENYEEFHRIDVEFRKSKGLQDSRMDVEFMKKYGTLLTAELGGRVISGQLFLEDKDHIRGLIAGSMRFGPDAHENNLVGYGNRLIVWEAIKYAVAKGIKEYDMGGFYTGTEKIDELKGVNVYKMSFGPSLVTKYNYVKEYSPIFGIAKRIYDYSAALLYTRSC
ncbi:MAG TPA: GNAT family N-acetyltransferase [Methanocellaceae archaeon]